MAPTSHVRGAFRRAISVLATLGLIIGMLAAAARSAGAVGRRCTVANLATGHIYLAGLQPAIDEAASGVTLRVSGTCVGNFTIGRNLTLQGKPTRVDPGPPTLDGNMQGTVLTVSLGTVVVDGLRITRGTGSGIYNEGSIALIGSSSVRGNTAGSGGGIFNVGTLTMNDSALVSRNTSSGFYAGGIFNEGTLTLNDSSSVSRNTASGWGGGIGNFGTLTLNGSSSVTGNTGFVGGGIYSNETLTLNDLSTVSGNRALAEGGGIANEGILTLNDLSTVSRNTAANLGGGVFSDGYLFMNDNSSVSRNAGSSGGGIYSFGFVTLNGSASVIGNTAADLGGGIFNEGGSVYVCEGSTVQLSPNDPDDPPATITISC